jgi:hypothetical protein
VNVLVEGTPVLYKQSMWYLILMYLARKNATVQQDWIGWVVKLTHTLLPISLKLRENGLRQVY